MDIKEIARKMIYHSPLMNYFDKDSIDIIFEHIYFIADEQEFHRKYYEATGVDFEGFLEGFNNCSGNYIGPKATPHTIIHEVLHELSSKFDENNHRIQNGIQTNMYACDFSLQINEGLTDYLAAKISGEKPRHYLQGHKLFSNLEKSAIEYFENDEILFSLYLNNREDLFKEFLDKNAR